MADKPILFSGPIIDRFWENVETGDADECWAWRGPINAKGYGRFHAGGHSMMAHRAAVWIDGREIPDRKEVDHICRNRGCVNPAHLRVVTHRENLLAGATVTAAAAARTHCPEGHPLSGENLFMRKGKRACRQCERDRQSRAYQPRGIRRRRRKKLTPEEIGEIQALIASGVPHRQIAPMFNISVATVSRVRNKE